jgi:hypothetical protein
MKKHHKILVAAILLMLGNARSATTMSGYDFVCFQSNEFGTASTTAYGSNATLSSLELEFAILVAKGNIPTACPPAGQESRTLVFVPSGFPRPTTSVEKTNLYALLMPLDAMRSYIKAAQKRVSEASPSVVWSASLMSLSEVQTASKAKWTSALESAATKLISDWNSAHSTP